MAELKTKVTNQNVTAFIASITDENRKKESKQLLKLFKTITGEKPKIWGNGIIGFGIYHYKSEKSKQEGDWMMTGFASRKQNLTIYIINGFKNFLPLLKKIGKHKISGGSCLYIKNLEDINLPVLEELIQKSMEDMKNKYKVK